MKKILIASLIIFSVSYSYGYDLQIIDKNLNLYYYSFNKSVSFDENTKKKFEWISKYKKYFEFGALAASGENFELDAITKQIDMDYYYGQLSNFYYNIPLPDENNVSLLKDNASMRRFMQIIESEMNKAASSIKNGNAEAGAFFLGTMTKYYCSLALWPYSMGKNSAFGSAKNEVIKEYFAEIDKFAASENLYKLDSQIKFDGYKNKFNIEEAVVNLIKFTVLDMYNPEPYKRMNAITMYNLLPMSDGLNRNAVVSKNVDSLSGLDVSYTDWNTDYVKQVARTLEYCANYLYEAFSEIPELDIRKPAEIVNLRFEPFDKRIRLYWDLSINRKIERQLIYQNNARTGAWEYIGIAGPQMQSHIVENLTNGNKYLFRVTLQEPLRPETQGKEIEALAIDDIPPAKPPKMIVDSLNNSIKIRLSKKQNDYDLKGYILYLYNDKNEFLKNVHLPKNFSSYLIENVTNGIKYKIALSAYDESLNESSEFEIGFAIPADVDAPAPVSNLTASGINNRITASWTVSPELNGDIEFQLLTLYDKDNKALKEFKLAPGIGIFTISGVMNDYEYKLGIKCGDEVPNLSPEIFTSVTPKFKGKIFSENLISIADNLIPFSIFEDVDGNGLSDIIVVRDFNIIIFYNNGKSKFEPVNTGITLDDTENFIKPFVCDLENDGKNDLLILQNGFLKAFRGLSYGKFEAIENKFKISANSDIKDLQILEINADGYPDLLILQKTGRIFLFENIKDYTFANANAELGISMTDSFDFIKAADFNKDGYSDILCKTNFAMNNNLLLLENKNGKSFDRKILIENADIKISCAEFADLNNDGKTDLFLTFSNIPINGGLYNNLLFWNTGKDLALRESKSQLDLLSEAASVCSGDYDGDGNSDLFISCKNKKNYIFKNKDLDFISENMETDIARQNDSIAYKSYFCDYNSDGDIDLLLCFDNKIIIFENNLNSYKKK